MNREPGSWELPASGIAADLIAGWPLSTPILQTAAFGFTSGAEASQAAADGHPLYSRDGLPNVTEFEQMVAELEGAEAAVAMPSGMAAIALTLMALCGPGDRVVAAQDAYPETRQLLCRLLGRLGAEPLFVDLAEPAERERAMACSPRLVLVETISNPGMRAADLPRIARAAQRTGAILCVDNTFASPALCTPITHGADLVLHSAGKLLAGHHDVTAGVVAGRRALIEAVRAERQLFGAVLAPMEAWLATRGLRTLKQRMAWISRSAEAIVPRLAAHPAVTRVSYPGFGPSGDLLPKGAGGLLAVCFTGGKGAAEQFIRSLRTIPYAATVGGPTTTVSYPPVEHRPSAVDAYACGTVRVSLGLEEPEEIWRDLHQALDMVAVPVLV